MVGFCDCFGAFDESRREIEFAAEEGFAGGHFAVVGFVIFAGEVEEAVEEQDADFVAQGVAVGGGLAGGGVKRDGEVAGVPFGEFGGRGEAEDVGGFVLAAKALVELAESGIIGEEDVDFAFEANCGAGAVEEAREAGGGEPLSSKLEAQARW